MNQAQRSAEVALDAFILKLESEGRDRELRALVQDVWAKNLDRYEPDELGDTPRGLGIQCSENLRELAVRRSVGDVREAIEDHWKLGDLVVSTPQSVLTLTFGARRLVPMKVPMAHGRVPQFNNFRDWEYQSECRNAMAQRNSAALGGLNTADLDQPMLFAETYDTSVVRDFILLWAGDLNSPLTAGYIAVPAKGPVPFAASTRLWWDDADVAPHGARRAPGGPNFDDIGVAAPAITLKPRPAIEGQA